jgi:hypothetical protein
MQVLDFTDFRNNFIYSFLFPNGNVQLPCYLGRAHTSTTTGIPSSAPEAPRRPAEPPRGEPHFEPPYSTKPGAFRPRVPQQQPTRPGLFPFGGRTHGDHPPTRFGTRPASRPSSTFVPRTSYGAPPRPRGATQPGIFGAPRTQSKSSFLSIHKVSMRNASFTMLSSCSVWATTYSRAFKIHRCHACPLLPSHSCGE